MSAPAVTKSRRSPRSSPDRRTAILRGARSLVAKNGFRDAQMTAVAEESGVALGTLYRYFPSKSALMVEVVALVSQREVDVAGDYALSEGPAVERLAAGAWAFASRALRGRRLAHAMVAEPVEPEIEAARLLYRRKLARVFETIIHQGIRAGEMPAQDVSASAACVVGSLFEGLVGPLAFETAATDRDRWLQAVAIVSFCMRATSGRDVRFEPSEHPPL